MSSRVANCYDMRVQEILNVGGSSVEVHCSEDSLLSSPSSILYSVPAKFCHECRGTCVLISLRDTIHYSPRIDYLFGLDGDLRGVPLSR